MPIRVTIPDFLVKNKTHGNAMKLTFPFGPPHFSSGWSYEISLVSSHHIHSHRHTDTHTHTNTHSQTHTQTHTHTYTHTHNINTPSNHLIHTDPIWDTLYLRILDVFSSKALVFFFFRNDLSFVCLYLFILSA